MKGEIKSSGPTSLRISYNSAGVEVAATRLHESRDREITGELAITGIGSAVPSRLLIPTSFNFSSLQRRDRTAATLTGRFEPVNWQELLEDTCGLAVEHIRRGEAVESWMQYEDAKPPTYLVEPFMPENQFSIIFGDGGSGKSKFARVLYIAATLGWEDNPLKLITKSHPSSGLILDWEDSPGNVKYDFKCLFNGLDIGPVVVNYLHCKRPFADTVEQIETAITKHEASFIIVDSLGAAAGGDLNATEPAFRFISAIRQFPNQTIIAIGHNAKNQEGRRSVYGNVYYTNEARSIWELRRAESTDPTMIEIGLFHRKSNISQYFPPIGYKFTFGLNKTEVDLCDVKTVADFLAQLGVQTRILEILKSCGKLSVSDLADQTGAAKTVVSATLTRLKQKGQVVYLTADKSWGLAARLLE